MTAAFRLATALMCVGFTASGCDDRNPTADIDRLLGLIGAEQDRVSSMEERLNQPPAAGVLVATTVAPSSSVPPEPSSSAPPVASVSSSAPPVAGPAYGEPGYTGPLPCTQSIFRLLTCQPDGSWDWL